MPQINQLAEVAYSQFFWLLLVLALIYYGIGHAMLPKIQSTIEARDRRIADDLAAAQAARTGAEETETAYRARIDAVRAEALKHAQAAKQESARATEERIRAANQANAATIEAAEQRIRAAAEAAFGEIETVAAEAAQEMVRRLAGISVSAAEAAGAVKEALANG
jgi:F-type H+-transporting ATPase subunit b